jgi:hypothetical protein
MPQGTHHSLAGTIGAYTKWANCENPTAATAPARKAFLDRFAREVDPEGVLPPEERARRATAARKAFYARLALMSAQARRRAKNATEEAEADEAELAASEEVA